MTPTELKQARVKAGINQEQMALKLGVGTSTLRRWEKLEVFTERLQYSVDVRFEKIRKELNV